MEPLDAVSKVLYYRSRHSLANLLSRAFVEFEISSTYGSLHNSLIATAEIYAPISDYDRLRALSREDNDQVLDAVLEVWPPRENDIEITGVIYRLDPGSLKDSPDDIEDLLQQLDRLRSIMIAVSTGGPRINDVNTDYKEDYFQLTKQLMARGLQNLFPIRICGIGTANGAAETFPRTNHAEIIFAACSSLLRRVFVRDLCRVARMSF